MQLVQAQVAASLVPQIRKGASKSQGTPWYGVDQHVAGAVESVAGSAGNVAGRALGCTYQGLMRGLRLQGNAGCDSAEQGKSYEHVAREMVQCSLVECAIDVAIGIATGGVASVASKVAKTYRKARKAAEKTRNLPRLAGGAPQGTGLKNASASLRALYNDGPIAGRSIIEIRTTLTEGGFARQALTKNRKGYLFNGPEGESVRVMRRGHAWDIRVQNRYGSYLDRFGDVGTPGTTHNIPVTSR